jgi:hypothetical protein
MSDDLLAVFCHPGVVVAERRRGKRPDFGYRFVSRIEMSIEILAVDSLPTDLTHISARSGS